MKFSISREALLKPLQVVSGVVEKRQTLPILSNVLLSLDNGTLTMTGTDLEVELQAKASSVEGESGEITLPARKFMDICRTLPEGANIQISIDSERALLRSGRSRFTLSTQPAAEFPSADAITGAFEFSVSQSILKRLLDQTHFCMANQDVRYYLNGVLLEVENNKLRSVATDGHRLAVSEQETELAVGDKLQSIIPRKGVLEISRLLEDTDDACTIQITPSYIKISTGDIVFTSKLVDGRFPDYERVMPSSSDKLVIADREGMRQMLVRTSILSNEKYRGVRLNLSSGLLRATVNNPEQEEAEEELEVQYQGDELEIGFNVSYMLDAINAVDEVQVQIGLTDSNHSCLINGVENSGSRYVVMPMRL